MEQFLAEILKDYGLPTLLLIAVLYAVWKLAEWVANHVVNPLVQAHMNFISGLTKSAEAALKLGQDNYTLSQRMSEQLDGIKDLIVSKNQQEILDRLEVLEGKERVS